MLNLENGRGYYETNHDTGGPDTQEEPVHTYELNTTQESVGSTTLPESKSNFLNSTDLDPASDGSSSASSGNTGSGVEFDTLEVVPTQSPAPEIVTLNSSPVSLHEFVQPGIIEPEREGWGRMLMNTGIKGDVAHLPLAQVQGAIATLDQATSQEMTLLYPNTTYKYPNYNDIIGVAVQTPYSHWADMPSVTAGSSVYRPVELNRGLASKIITVGDYWGKLSNVLTHPEQVGDTPPSLSNSTIVPLIADASTGIFRPTIYAISDENVTMERMNYYGDMDILHSIETGEMGRYSQERGSTVYVPVTELIYPDTAKELQQTAPKVYSQKHWINRNATAIAIQNGVDKYPELTQVPNLSEIEYSSPLIRALKKTGIADERLWEIVESIDRDTETIAFRLHTKRPEPVQAYARTLARASEEARSKVK